MPVLTKRHAIAAALLLASSVAPASSALSATNSSSVPIAIPARFQSGDRVRLRSGGPMMTVDNVKGDQVHCIWMDIDGAPADATFPVGVLQRF